MHVPSRWVSLASTLALTVGVLVVAGAGPASADTYTPPAGVRMNDPAGSTASKNSITTHLVRSIYSAPRNTRIRVMSWNIRSHRIAEALVRAHRRGVSVQILMEKINAYEHEPDESNPIPASAEDNPDFWWMQREFRRGSDTRRPGYRSWARLCANSCRGRSGLAHVKMVLFEQVHTSRKVVMYGSANLTDAAAGAQWNDWFTSVGRSGLWDFALLRFNEMARDRAMVKPWRVNSFSGIRMGFFPWYGEGTQGDPVQRVFNRIKCTGATGGTGINGRTKIRVAQTAIAGERGIKLARGIRALWNAGCDVRIVYGLINDESRRILASSSGRGPMPIRQIAQDFDGDFVYDRYLHQKSMAVSGVVGSRTNATYAWNGSANWVGYTLSSDEIFTYVNSPAAVNHYSRFVDSKYFNPPRSARGNLPAGYARIAGIDPYAKFEIN